jgi:hypothetical protein
MILNLPVLAFQSSNTGVTMRALISCGCTTPKYSSEARLTSTGTLSATSKRFKAEVTCEPQKA